MSGEIKPVLPNHLPPPTYQQPAPLNSAPPSHLPSATSSNFPSDSSGFPPDSAHSYTSNTLVKQQQLSPASLTHSHNSHHSHSLSHSTTHSQPPSNPLPLTAQPQSQAPVPVDDSMSSGEVKKAGSTGPDKAKPHLCTICNRGFTTGGHLQRHQRIHTGVKAFKCPFPGCETRTSRQDNLQQHYRTHLSPTLRRGSGSAARAAVAQAMEAAGLKSTSSRAPRKSKSSTNGTPSSNTSAGTSHIPSPYATPTSQNGHYGYPQMYDPQQYAYPVHHPPPGLNLANTTQTSSTSSRGPSPANGHSSGHSSVSSIPGSQPPHHQSYYPQPFPPAYPYYQYRYPPPPGQMMASYGPPGPPGPPPHAMYSPGIAPDHAQGQMYSPIASGFGTHSRESSYSGVMPGYGPGPSPMGNGYQRHNSTGSLHPTSAPALPPPDRARYSPPRRRSPPDLMGQGVVDPNNMGRSNLHMSYGPNGTEQTNGVSQVNGYTHHSAPTSASGSGPSGHPHLSAYAFGQQAAPGSETLARGQGRASISSLSDGGSGGGSEGSGGKQIQ